MNIIEMLKDITKDRKPTTATQVSEHEWILDEDPYVAQLLDELIETLTVN